MLRLGLIRRPLTFQPPVQSFNRLNSSSSTRRYHLGYAALRGVVATLAGTGTILVAGYAFYHFSGAKKAVDTFKPAMFFLGQTREKLAKEAPSQALAYLRQAAKAYVAFLPGAGFVVDRGFDALGDVVDAHADEANAITKKAYDEILEVVSKDGNDHSTSSAVQIITITRRLVRELTALGLKAGKPVSEKLELERRASDVGAAAGAFYQDVKSKTPVAFQAFEQLKDKVKKAPKSDNRIEVVQVSEGKSRKPDEGPVRE
ncbi:hypothetical protein GALMADRAFT_249397 [Galerina marginata CBS 339.88]|uniref:Uncharacterized protein n=1 Tax=Galerina marginata (strain CBS 339.88) TaxID=685588 RepID=A0A067SWS6_GALM3|nr:hypothetical protein GALMADRAFT_249397 [Galerina marginata CBS 339.88]